MSAGPRNVLGQGITELKEGVRLIAIQVPDESDDPGRVREWFAIPDAHLLVRRRHVWGLLRWYHHDIIRPQLGLGGVFRRLWWRLSGQRARLLSPWEQLARRIEEAEAVQERAATNGVGSE